MGDRALYVIRQSQGDHDDTASLRFQRAVVPPLARDLVDGDWSQIDGLDLGVHTGYSIHTLDKVDKRIDADPEVVKVLDRVENVVYSYIVALDDVRLARDEYFAEWKRRAAIGNAEFVFFEDSL